jgi:glycosyltransferase involved in cell wall biosynthesis
MTIQGERIRVLHVITTGERRGAEMFAADLIRYLSEADVDQRVAVLRGSFPLPVGYEAASTILPSSRRRLPGMTVDPATVNALRSLCRFWSPHIVQAHGGQPFTHATLAARRSKERVLYRRIGLSPERTRRGVTNLAYRLLLRRCKKIVAVAEAVRRETIDVFGVPPHRVVTIPGGVDGSRIRSDLGRERAREMLGVAQAAPVVLSLGALSWEKDPMTHLDVMGLVRRSMPGAVHLIVGDGPLRDEVARRVQRLGLDGQARVLGNRSDGADLLAASDVLLLASQMEGMPGCVIEAGMAGVPVVSYAVAGVSEVVVDDVTGYVVEQRDVSGLAQQLLKVLGNSALRTRLGTAARVRCDSLFDINVVGPQYLSTYREILS